MARLSVFKKAVGTVKGRDKPFSAKQTHAATMALLRQMRSLALQANKRTLAVFALSCAKAVLPVFEKAHPKDTRPRQALETLKAWLRGECNVTPARHAALAAHAAARQADGEARFAARACGQAVSVAHAKLHAVGAAYYADKAVPGRLKADCKRLERLLAVKR